MKPSLLAVLAVSAFGLAGPAAAQQSRQITAADIAAAQTLLGQMKPACDAGSDNHACGVLAYSPVDCTAKRIQAHVRQVYATYADGSVRFQQGNTGVVRRAPIVLLAPIGLIGRDGSTTQYGSPQFVSWEEYQSGKKSVTICSKSERIEVKDFTLSNSLEKFLKANE